MRMKRGYNKNDTLQTAHACDAQRDSPRCDGAERLWRRRPLPRAGGRGATLGGRSRLGADRRHPLRRLRVRPRRRILDESGRELASNDDNRLHLQDPVVAAKLPRDGVAFVEVRRSVFVPTTAIIASTSARPIGPWPRFPGRPGRLALGDPTADRRPARRIRRDDRSPARPRARSSISATLPRR